MEPVAILLLLFVLAIILLFVTRPFFEKRQTPSSIDGNGHSALLAERERLLIALQELDFDQTLGKIPVEEYPIQRAALLQKGAEVLRKLDAINPEYPGNHGQMLQSDSGILQSNPRLSDTDLDDLLIKRRAIQKAKTAGFCPKCGKPVLQSDVFCPSCGNSLK
jgi:hypothetical protein